MQKTPDTADESAIPGVLFTGERPGPLGSVCALRRAGSFSLHPCYTALCTGVPGPGLIDCGQLPRSRLTISELSGELLSKSVQFESDVGAAEQAARLLTSDTRIQPEKPGVKGPVNVPIYRQRNTLATNVQTT